MSALGQKQTCAAHKVMSALTPKADMCGATRDVRFVPKADIVPQKKDRLAAVSPDFARYARRSFQIDLRSGLNPARTSSERSFGCSQAAKCPPLSSLL